MIDKNIIFAKIFDRFSRYAEYKKDVDAINQARSALLLKMESLVIANGDLLRDLEVIIGVQNTRINDAENILELILNGLNVGVDIYTGSDIHELIKNYFESLPKEEKVNE